MYMIQYVLGHLVHLVDKQGSDNAKDQAGNQLHDDAIQPEVDREHAVRVEPGGLWQQLCIRISLVTRSI